MVNRRNCGPYDVHIGQRIRELRVLLGISQSGLGEKIGLTFQQIQKYEIGVNRVGAGRLFEIAQVLATDIGYFFEGISINDGLIERAPATDIELTLLRDAEIRMLLRRLADIKHRAVRRRVLRLIEAFADAELGEEDSEKSSAHR